MGRTKSTVNGESTVSTVINGQEMSYHTVSLVKCHTWLAYVILFHITVVLEGNFTTLHIALQQFITLHDRHFTTCLIFCVKVRYLNIIEHFQNLENFSESNHQVETLVLFFRKKRIISSSSRLKLPELMH